MLDIATLEKASFKFATKFKRLARLDTARLNC